MKIVLLGYMASGKSSVGKNLAKEHKMQFVDLDSFIEMKEQNSITEIFSKKGEIYFRLKESEYLGELLLKPEDLIISLGGGTPCYANNMKLIDENSISFYLKASINTLYERLKSETSQRPLVATIGQNNLKEYIAKHLFERNLFYEKATHTIIVDKKSIPDVCNEIKSLL